MSTQREEVRARLEPMLSYLVKIVDRAYLERYDDGRPWFLCLDDTDLCHVAYVVIEGRLDDFKTLVRTGQVWAYDRFSQVPGLRFEYIELQDAGILKVWRGN